MQTVTLEEAQAKLPELIRALPTEREITIIRGNQTVAKITGVSPAVSNSQSVLNIAPVSVGRVLRPYPDPADDILGEMLERE